jgi:Tudor domain
VQLQKNAMDLQTMINGLDSMEDMKLLLETPCVGQAVLAHSTNHRLSRGVVTKINNISNTCEIFHVDFGDTDVLPLESLFQIPEMYMKIRIMASPLKMSKLVELPANIPENVVKNAFTELIDNDPGLSIEVDSESDNPFSIQTVVVWTSKKINIMYELLDKLQNMESPTLALPPVIEPDNQIEEMPIQAKIDT